MRWDNLRIDSTPATTRDPAAGCTPVGGTLPLIERDAVVRTFDTPGFRGMTFYEVQAKSIVSQVPEASRWSRSATPSTPTGAASMHVPTACAETPILMADGTRQAAR